MTNILEKICADKFKHIEHCKKLVSEQSLLKKAKAASPTRGFLKFLKEKASKGEFALIAEIKKASPSRGLIRKDFDPAKLAIAYENAGATCLSVLTDIPYFQGKDEYLLAARNACSLPVLRKDFILDTYQVIEARAIGADCILLIMAAVDNEKAAQIEKTALSLDMDVLIEVHDETELQRALKLSSRLIGINNRNLKTLEIDLGTTENLVKNIPDDYLVVCESGISSHNDLERMAKFGIYCFLVGESLMRENDVEKATRTLLKDDGMMG